jgi:membrane protease YdiL (CAAX protease family)
MGQSGVSMRGGENASLLNFTLELPFKGGPEECAAPCAVEGVEHAGDYACGNSDNSWTVGEWSERAPDALPGWLLLALKGLGSGLAVALIEETFFRGAMQGALQRLGAMRTALFAVPVFYSAVHFLGRAGRVPYEEVNAASGFVALQGFFAGYAAPLAIVEAFVALWFVGLLLALVRLRWGDLAGCIGLHAGFVAVIAVCRRASAPAPESQWSFMVGSFDGLLGVWIALLTALCCIAVWRLPRRTN